MECKKEMKTLWHYPAKIFEMVRLQKFHNIIIICKTVYRRQFNSPSYSKWCLTNEFQHEACNAKKGVFPGKRNNTGTEQGVGLGGSYVPPLFWMIKSLFFFFTLVNLVCLLQKKYITLFYVKYADLLVYSLKFGQK